MAEDLAKFKEEEEKFLRKQREEMEDREILESAALRKDRASIAQAWAKLERLRSSYLWVPIRFDDHPADVLDFPVSCASPRDMRSTPHDGSLRGAP